MNFRGDICLALFCLFSSVILGCSDQGAALDANQDLTAAGDAGSLDFWSNAGDRGEAGAVQADQGQALFPNSGAICNTKDQPCSHPEDNCVRFPGKAKGMCQAECKKINDNCPVSNGQTMRSLCSSSGLREDGSQQLFCAHVCKMPTTDAAGVTKIAEFACPNDTDFACVQGQDARGNLVDLWFCDPK